MKKLLALLLVSVLLTGCASPQAETTAPEDTAPRNPVTETVKTPATGEIVDILLEGQNITLGGEAPVAPGAVYISRDIVYYEERTAYESGNPYGEGEKSDMHTAEEAASHLVVNITAPGTYRLRGKLDPGQIRIDLGEDAYDDPKAVVNLILDGVDITCTVAPAILFQNVYECDGDWSADTAKPDVDTSAAGANLILAENSENHVSGSYVAKIYKDKEGEKKRVKQDGAVYSYMSMNVYGPGSLDLNAENEGLDTELHLSIFGGNIAIRSGNDGINTNEDGVSVTAIYGGDLRIMAGLDKEGDGIDSNGYLVIYGGTVVSAAHPASDAGLDSDLGSFIHGGTVVALGAPMDWAESDSGQVTMNLQFAQQQSAGSALVIAREDGSVVFAYDPSRDEVLGENARTYQGAVLSCPDFRVGEGYALFIGASVSGDETAGIYDANAAAGFTGGAQMAYTGTDVTKGPGGFGDFKGGQRPEDDMRLPEDMQPPEGDYTIPTPPEGSIPMEPMGDRNPPAGEPPVNPDQNPPTGVGSYGREPGNANKIFYMQDKVNFFSGISMAE